MGRARTSDSLENSSIMFFFICVFHRKFWLNFKKILIDNNYKTIFESVRSACSSYKVTACQLICQTLLLLSLLLISLLHRLKIGNLIWRVFFVTSAQDSPLVLHLSNISFQVLATGVGNFFPLMRFSVGESNLIMLLISLE